jgi:hypothetical protein
VRPQQLGALHRQVSAENPIVTIRTWSLLALNILLTAVASDRPWGWALALAASAALHRGCQAPVEQNVNLLCMPNRRDGFQDHSSRLLCKASFLRLSMFSRLYTLIFP